MPPGPFPPLPPGAAYLRLSNPAKRNALSLAVLHDLRAQLHAHLTPRGESQPLLLPPFQPSLLDTLHSQHAWLTEVDAWRRRRASLPHVLVLRSTGPVFCSGHDLGELAPSSSNPDTGAHTREAFALCGEVMGLLRRSPAPVVCPVQGLATAAGFQLALATDIPIALASTRFCLPGMRIGLPCTSPATAVARRLLPGVAYRLFATGETVAAGELEGAVDVVPVPEHAEAADTAEQAFEARVEAVVGTLAGSAGQAQALGKWAFWTQLRVPEEEAARWAGRAMAVHAASADGQEGMDAFLNKRAPAWHTGAKGDR